MRVELIYEKSCPNIDAAREQLCKAFAETDIVPAWLEWEVSDPNAPAYIHGYGSPTILVNTVDVTNDDPAGSDLCCRVYSEDNRYNGVPALDDIKLALVKNNSQN